MTLFQENDDIEIIEDALMIMSFKSVDSKCYKLCAM